MPVSRMGKEGKYDLQLAEAPVVDIKEEEDFPPDTGEAGAIYFFSLWLVR